MARQKPRETDQRLVRRTFLFSTFPVIVIGLLGANFIWEVIKANVDGTVKESWPLRFVILDLSTTAALLGAVAGLHIARLQWAKATRPAISFVIVDKGGEFAAASDQWFVWIHNGGPGIGVVENFSYIVKFRGQPRSIPVTVQEINAGMEARGLHDGVDYFIREVGKGASYPPTAAYTEGSLICWFKRKAIVELDDFDIVVLVRDAIGDWHQRTLEVRGKMPSIALKGYQTGASG